jgi:hypothetical protein
MKDVLLGKRANTREVSRDLSAEIDRLLAKDRDAGATGRQPPETIAGELAVAHRLQQMVARLPPVPAELERRVDILVRSQPACLQRPAWRPALWSAMATAVVLLAVWMILPGLSGLRGPSALAQMRDVLLGQTRVGTTPTLESGEARAVREPLRDLVAAEVLTGRAPALPKVLPAAFGLQEVVAVSYPDLPSWISQPFYVEQCYGTEEAPCILRLRQYRLLFKDFGGISRFQVASGAVRDVEEVDLRGATGTLLTLSPQRGRAPVTYTVVWERDGLLLELETDSLSREQLLQVAGSVR